MEDFLSPFGRIQLTDERKRHIFRFHPEVRAYRKYFEKTIRRPDMMCRSKYDAAALILYRLINGKYLAVVVKTNQRNFILTAYLTKRIYHKPL